MAAHAADTTRLGGAAVSTVTRALLPELPNMIGKRVGPLVATFANIFHRPNTPTEVGYLSEHREFGWIWYDHPNQTIEGTHRTSAILEVASRVRYLRVQIVMLADWRGHGTWQRAFEVVLDLGAGASPP